MPQCSWQDDGGWLQGGCEGDSECTGPPGLPREARMHVEGGRS